MLVSGLILAALKVKGDNTALTAYEVTRLNYRNHPHYWAAFVVSGDPDPLDC
ncbi:MAG: hypothetical protein AAGG51_03595 [Cyanobacteria bacterium P01_G01_bin.54]